MGGGEQELLLLFLRGTRLFTILIAFTRCSDIDYSYFADTIDKEKKAKHSKLADGIEEVIQDPSRINVKLKVRNYPLKPRNTVCTTNIYLIML